jgi:hypothetical protein
MDPLGIIHRRLRAQRLTGEPLGTPAEAVAWSGAVQAQEWAEAKWSLAQRVSGADDATVEAACDRGEIIRTHALRPTWHLLAAEDLRWIQRLTGPRVHQGNGYSYRRDGLDADTLARTDEHLVRTLQDGEPRTRPELRAALESIGIETPGQRLAHTVMHAELEALIVSGPRRGRQHTYVLAEGRVPEAPDRTREADLAELVRRFFSSHGPATVRDFTWWSSLTVKDARAGIDACGDALIREEDADGTAWFSARDAERPAPGPTGVHLIPMYDELGVAHRDLRVVHAAEPPPVGQLERPILLDGRTVGTWRRTLTARTVTVQPACSSGSTTRRRPPCARRSTASARRSGWWPGSTWPADAGEAGDAESAFAEVRRRSDHDRHAAPPSSTPSAVAALCSDCPRHLAPSHGSAGRSSTVRRVKERASSAGSPTSAQATGAATGAPGRARTV